MSTKLSFLAPLVLSASISFSGCVSSNEITIDQANKITAHLLKYDEETNTHKESIQTQQISSYIDVPSYSYPLLIDNNTLINPYTHSFFKKDQHKSKFDPSKLPSPLDNLANQGLDIGLRYYNFIEGAWNISPFRLMGEARAPQTRKELIDGTSIKIGNDIHLEPYSPFDKDDRIFNFTIRY